MIDFSVKPMESCARRIAGQPQEGVMKRYVMIWVLVLFSLTLIGCASTCRFTGICMDLTKENWQLFVNRNPKMWTPGASFWFLTGNPSGTELYNRRAPLSDQMSTMQVRVAQFANIKANGTFKLQVFQTDRPNSVWVSGPNAGVRGLSIVVRNGTLCLEQPPSACPEASRVIVRVGVRHLMGLTQMGRGPIEVANLQSECLYINTSPGSSGNIYLSGDVNLKCINHRGMGCVVVLGANTPALSINTWGGGSINVSGNVGIRSIVHTGTGNINIIGANSDCLDIVADGCGKIGIDGRVNVKRITAKDKVAVLIDGAQSQYIYVYVCGDARVGLSGETCDLYVQAGGKSRFLGRFLCAHNAYVKACECAHINVTAGSRIFASARDNSSVYFFGSPDALSQFVSDNGVVMPIYGAAIPNACRPRPIPTCKTVLPPEPSRWMRPPLRYTGAG